MKKKRQHIHQILSLAMLWVFSLAITPWSALHHHEQAPEIVAEKHCAHKVHVKSQQETCLICAAHFEKDFTASDHSYVTYLSSELMFENILSISSSYAELIATSLRGPPAFS